MEGLLTWTPEDWTAREPFEAMVAAVGGRALAEAQAEATEARHAFEATLTPEQRRVYGLASDAAAEAGLEREHAATAVALIHGIAIGAGLATLPEVDNDRLLELSADLAGLFLSAGLDPSAALRANEAIVGALRRADRVAARRRRPV